MSIVNTNHKFVSDLLVLFMSKPLHTDLLAIDLDTPPCWRRKHKPDTEHTWTRKSWSVSIPSVSWFFHPPLPRRILLFSVLLWATFPMSKFVLFSTSREKLNPAQKGKVSSHGFKTNKQKNNRVGWVALFSKSVLAHLRSAYVQAAPCQHTQASNHSRNKTYWCYQHAIDGNLMHIPLVVLRCATMYSMCTMLYFEQRMFYDRRLKDAFQVTELSQRLERIRSPNN